MELSSPVVSPSAALLPEATTILAPTQEMTRIQEYTQICMAGALTARMCSALQKSS